MNYETGVDASIDVDVDNDMMDQSGHVNFEAIEQFWLRNQKTQADTLQQVQVYIKNVADPVYLKAKMSVILDLLENWYDVKAGKDQNPLWVEVTGVFCTSIDLREVIAIQARPEKQNPR